MTIEQLFEEAKRRYPIGTKFHPVSYHGEISRDKIVNIEGVRIKEWINPSFPKEAQAITEADTPGIIYAFGVWAPIVGEELSSQYEIY